MAPAAEHILRFAVAGDDAAFVLVQAVQTGSNALDLRLVATEGAAPYVTESEFLFLFHSQSPCSCSALLVLLESSFAFMALSKDALCFYGSNQTRPLFL